MPGPWQGGGDACTRQGAIAGYGIAIPVGPIAVPIVDRGLWRLRRATIDATAVDVAPTDTTAARTFASVLGLTLRNPITVAYFAALVLGGSLVILDLALRMLVS